MELECFLLLLIIVTILGCTCAVNISTTEKINRMQWFYHENMKSMVKFMADRYHEDMKLNKQHMKLIDEKLKILFKELLAKEQDQK